MSFIRTFIEPIKRRRLYFVMDILLLAAWIFFSGRLAEIEAITITWMVGFIITYIGYAVAIVLLSYDGEYLSGLAWYRKNRPRLLFTAVVIFGTYVGGAAGMYSGLLAYELAEIYSTSIPYNSITILFLSLLLPWLPVVMYYLFPYRRAGRAAGLTGGSVWLVRVPAEVLLFAFSLFVLRYCYAFANIAAVPIAEFRKQFGMKRFLYEIVTEPKLWYQLPLDAFIMSLMFIMMYLPVRIHYFVRYPGDKGRLLWFLITSLLVGFYAVTGIRLF